MKFYKSFMDYSLQLLSKYPAVFSGYIIYSYLFISIIRFFLKAKYQGATLSDAYDIFSALPFMWLLAVALVKVIDYRTQLHNKEKALQIKNAQLTTLHEVVKALQHQVNNPLTIISLSVGQAKRALAENPVALKRIESIETAANQISLALIRFSEAEHYESEHVDEVVGTITSMPKTS